MDLLTFICECRTLQLVAEKDQCDREKWEIIQKARHAAEQAVYLQTQSESREQHISKLETELSEVGKGKLTNNIIQIVSCLSVCQ